MKQFVQTKKSGNFAYVVCLVAIGLCWRVGEYVNAELAKIEPRALQQFASRPVAPQQITFTPYQSAGMKGEAESALADSVDFDDVFRTKEEPKVDLVSAGVVQAPKEPQYADMIRQMVSVDSVADNGAVLNGRFTSTGSVAEQLAVTGATGQTVAPTLVEVTRSGVKLSVAKEIFEIKATSFGGRP